MAKQTKAATPATEVGSLLMLDPNIILADDNTRLNLKQSSVESLAQSIMDRGEVMEPVEVEPITGSENGFKYRLTTGFYRLAAVKHLNVAAGAGLSIPALVKVASSPQERLKRQIEENIKRESLSPMDQAIAIKRLMDSGMSKVEVRAIFSRPGGRKGNKTQPASNSFINMTLSFLDLPKAIQEKIHSGLVGVAAAYELTKVAPEKRQQVLDRAEAARQADIEREEEEDERLMNAERKLNEDREKREKAKAELDRFEADAKAAKEMFESRTDGAVEAHKIAIGKHPDAASKKLAQTAFKEAEKQRLSAEADADEKQKAYEAMKLKYEKAETAAAEKAAKVKEAKAAVPQGAAKKKDAVGPKDVQRAAAAEGASQNFVPLNAQEMRKVVADLCLPGGNADIIEIGKAFVQCFAGETTEKQLYKVLLEIVS